MRDDTWSGGCQCGAVRYAFSVRPDNPCVCHCRMCQKQFGNFFGAFAGSDRRNFTVTRGEIAYFQSSEVVRRGFCRDCGTPLTFEALDGSRVSVSIGSLDRHTEMQPRVGYGAEAREPWLVEIAGLPTTATGVLDGDDPARVELISRSNLQHPDHDTSDWPGASGRAGVGAEP